MTLGEHQRLFTRLLPQLIVRINDGELECVVGEVERGEVQAIVNSLGVAGRQRLSQELMGQELFTELRQAIARCGTGTLESNHRYRLAADIHLFRGGEYLTSTEDHQPFGEYWETLHPLCRWGGRFKDGNHYSLEWNGRK